MSLFEGYERRIKQIQPVMDKYGIKRRACRVRYQVYRRM